MKESLFVFSVGFLAQILFSARILVQWLLSEKSKRVESPTLFWVLSIAGSYLLCWYGWLRDDFSIILGQFIAYYIYLWNLNEKGWWQKVPRLFKAVLVLTPVLVGALMLNDAGHFADNFLKNEQIPLWLLILGSAGQVIFTLRFVYQWLYSYRSKESLLPAGFWIISLVGSLIIVIYGIIRLDPVLVLGQSVGFVAYSRNLVIGYHTSIKQPDYEN